MCTQAQWRVMELRNLGSPYTLVTWESSLKMQMLRLYIQGFRFSCPGVGPGHLYYC